MSLYCGVISITAFFGLNMQEEISFVFHQIEKARLSYDLNLARNAIATAHQLGITPLDLAFGIMQPLIYIEEECWSKRHSSMAESPQFISFCEATLPLLFQEFSQFKKLRQSRCPEVLLVNCKTNFHTLGIQIIELFLITQGVPCFTVYPGLPVREIFELVQFLRPRFLGVSVATNQQLEELSQLENLFLSRKIRHVPKMMVGGNAVQSNQSLMSGIRSKPIYDLEQLLMEITEHSIVTENTI